MFRITWDPSSGSDSLSLIEIEWWVPCDPKHVGVIFNVFLLDIYATQVLTSTTVLIECINWLIKVTSTVAEFRGTVFPRNIRIRLSIGAKSCPVRAESSSTSLRKPPDWHNCDD